MTTMQISRIGRLGQEVTLLALVALAVVAGALAASGKAIFAHAEQIAVTCVVVFIVATFVERRSAPRALRDLTVMIMIGIIVWLFLAVTRPLAPAQMPPNWIWAAALADLGLFGLACVWKQARAA